MSKIRKNNPYVALLLLGILSACGGDKAADAVPQHWHGMEVRVESRPSPPHVGMNEFLIIVTGEHGKPDSDLIVSLRTSDQDAWNQSMQDGLVGVYRRAARVDLGSRSVLQVQIRKDGEESVLQFPLKVEH